MIHDNDLALVRSWIHARIKADRPMSVASAGDSRGVPPSMWLRPPDGEGWVEWKPSIATITERDVAHLESTLLRAEYPPLFRAYLVAYSLMEVRVDGVELPATLPGDSLGKLRLLIDSFDWLVVRRFVPMGYSTDMIGPVCFDTARRSPDGDCPMVLVDRSAALGLPDSNLDGPFIESISQELFGSFREFIQTTMR